MVWIFLAQSAVAWPTFAQEPQSTAEIPALVLTQQQRISNATPHIGYFVDRQNQFSIAEIVQPSPGLSFAPVQKTEPNFGFEKAPIWLRMPMRNADDVALERILVMRTNS